MDLTLPPNPAVSPPPSSGFDLHSRLRAAGIHLALSALVAALAAALVFVLWYPMPFREVSGGRELFILVISVDFVLGPLITFAVFDRRKPWTELRRDLAIVVLLQLAALGYGLHTVYVARPVVMALEVDRLRVVTALDLDPTELAEAPPEWQQLPLWGVPWLSARLPRAGAEKQMAVQMVGRGKDIGMLPQLWEPASATAAAIQRGARPLDGLRARYPSRAAELDAALRASGRPAERLRYLPILAHHADWVAFIDAANGDVVGYANFDGF